MMKLAFFSNGFKSTNCKSLMRDLFFSTETQTSKPKTNIDILYDKISSLVDQKESVIPILDQWNQQGKSVKQHELQSLIRQFRDSKRFNHALEISQWMSNQGRFPISPSDNAVRLGLISTVCGIEEAEKYFFNLPKEAKRSQVYHVLLEDYAQNKSVKKAESLMGLMRKSGLVKASHDYNLMLNVYANAGQCEELDALVKEMNDEGVCPNKVTFKIRFNAYAATLEIIRMEKILQGMEGDPDVVLDSLCYVTAANAYIKAGATDKALDMLKKSEKGFTMNKRRLTYDSLLKLYASIGRKDDLYRIWNQYKASGEVYSIAHHFMIASLIKVNDIVGAEKFLEEFESRYTRYDFQDYVIAAYWENNLLEKAMDKGMKPFGTTLEILATGYIASDHIPKAVEAIRTAFLIRRPGWKPNRDILAACLLHVKQQEDAKQTKEFLRFLGAPSHISTDNFERLLDYYYNSEPEFGKVEEEMDAACVR
ncbi:hypothetical protein AQUCO_00800202v1 [Aquilegia coerulea]|uniref:Pentacotripeptide-repeat region of PRORP domain-containing protein n=1 Tax=Aquilegia coerulea TaxID=218851 RepID=A0A2G5EHU8_AQUCA|nr:hypothetical protein AQUCO_00800202v1 [Aquilegia coerulea]